MQASVTAGVWVDDLSRTRLTANAVARHVRCLSDATLLNNLFEHVYRAASLDEVVARINAILRRTKQSQIEDAILEVGEVRINQDAHEVFVNDEAVDLSPTEYKLLRFLMENANRVLTKAQILDHVWEYDFNGEMGIVESYVSYLRKKLDVLTKEPVIITKRGVGYMFKSTKAN